jgi:hypothetical protein
MLDTLPELHGMSVITSQEDLNSFLKKLRQDYYSPEKLKKELHLHLHEELAVWLKSKKPDSLTFFAVFDEPDNHAKNDDWGHYELFRCILIRTTDEKIYLMKTLIKNFHH